MDLGVRGKSYIVLGGSRGMGYETARLLAAEGANLTLMSRTQAQLEAAGKTIADEFGVEVLALAADGMASGEVDKVVAASIARFGAPRGLLVTSGLTFHNGTILEATDADWDYNFQDVLMGHVRAARAVLPSMIAAGGGQIVTTAAYSARAAKSFLFPYASLKAAVVNFTKNLAKTYGPQGVRANCIAPGAFATVRVNQRVDDIMAERDLSRAEARRYVMHEVFKMPVALDRPGEPHEIAEMMAFALSERAAYMTGAIINVDGGTDF
jgi:3-oxoacyl-[acyl-carrier protein] reductase